MTKAELQFSLKQEEIQLLLNTLGTATVPLAQAAAVLGVVQRIQDQANAALTPKGAGAQNGGDL